MKYLVTKKWEIDEREFTAPYQSEALKRELIMKLIKLKKPKIEIKKY